MNELSLQRLMEFSVLSESDPPELKSLYSAAVEGLDLLTIDYQTIRDLVRLSGTGDVVLHLILIALFSSLAEGSVCLNCAPESLERILAPVRGAVPTRRIREIPGRISGYPALVHCRDESSPPLFEDPCEAYKPLILVRSGSGLFLYFQKYYAAEEAARNSLASILARGRETPVDAGALASAVKQVIREKPVILRDGKALLNSGQKLGVLLPALKNFVLISGGPGTGKTFIVLSLLRVMIRLGVSADRIAIAAPTGRAARKLTDSIARGIASIPDRDLCDESLLSIQGVTVHRLLRYSPSRDDYLHNRCNPVPADLIIIDEASMIDIVLLGKLFDAAGPGATLVMLGDRNQLPSVEAGSVLADLIPGDGGFSFSRPVAETMLSIVPDLEIIGPETTVTKRAGSDDPFADRIVVLRESYRSEESIKRIADGINRQDHAVIDLIPEWDRGDELPGEGVWRIDPGKAGESPVRVLRRVLALWAARYYDSPSGDAISYRSLVEEIAGTDLEGEACDASPTVLKILARLDEARILTPLRSGLTGAAGVNGAILDKLRPSFDPAGSRELFPGTPVIITRNDHERGLFNGDVGLMLKGRGGRRFAAFAWSGGMKLFPAESLPPFEPSFCITVHKSQGSEYGNVLLLLPEGTPERLLTREIFYTGITRAKHCVIIYASRAALAQAIRNRTERESRIRFN